MLPLLCLACGRSDGARRTEAALDEMVLPTLVAAKEDPLRWISNRPGTTFLTGFSNVQGVPRVAPGVFRTFGPRGAVRLHQFGGRSMRVVVVGWINLPALMTDRVVVSAYVGRRFVGKVDVREGPFVLEPIAPASWFPRESDEVLEIVASTVGSPDGWPPELNVAVVHHVGWRVEP